MGAAAQPPRTRQDREAFARNPNLSEEALGIPISGQQPPSQTGNKRQGFGAVQSKSQRRAPETLLGAKTDSNARSTGRSLIKDPATAGSLLS